MENNRLVRAILSLGIAAVIGLAAAGCKHSTDPKVPAVPTGLKVVSTTETTVTVIWNSISGAAQYNVYAGISEDELTLRGSPESAYYVIESLTANTEYYIAVSAENSAGESEQCTAISVTTNTIVLPAAPTGLALLSNTETSITISWDAVAGADTYNVYAGTEAGNLDLKGSPAATNYVIDNLVPDTTYYIEVSAENEAGEGGNSRAITVTTNLSIKPAAPTGLSATEKAENSITISWNSVTGATGYKVFVGNTDADMSLHGEATETSYTITELAANTVYHIAVSARTATNESDQSDSISALTKPAAPDGLAAGVITSNSITVSWTAIDSVSGYMVYAGTESDNMTQWGTPTDASYTITGLNGNTEYYIAVSAENASGESEWSSPITATTKLPAPTGLIATPQMANNSIQVSWNAVAGAASYKIYRSTDPAAFADPIDGSGTESDPFRLNANQWANDSVSSAVTEVWYAINVNAGTTYRVWWNDSYAGPTPKDKTGDVIVGARHENGTFYFGGSGSNFSTTSVDSGWTTPSSFTPTASGTVYIRVIPYSSSYYGTFGIVYSTGAAATRPETTPPVEVFTTTGTSYNDTGRTTSTTYYYKVSAVTTGGVEGDLSDYVYTAISAQTKEITSFRFDQFSVNATISGPNINITVPNIVNLTTLVPTINHNGKSISPTSGVAQDFSNSSNKIQYTVTAEDNTTTTYTVTVTVTSTDISAAFTWINSNARSGQTYTIVAQTSPSVTPRTINHGYSNVNIILSGGTTARTITLSGNGSLFTINSGTLTLDNNITLQGHSSNNASLVTLNNSSANLVMNTGSRIINNTATVNYTSATQNAIGGGVNVGSGTFTMNGGTISGNDVRSTITGSGYTNTVRAMGGGVYVSTGIFIMNGGTITNNTAYSEYYATAGGGVYINNGTFTLINGTISNNTADSRAQGSSPYSYGGGVAVWNSSEFKMQGGTISGNQAVSSAFVGVSTNYYGGGVYVRNDKFTKTGGTIYGSNASPASLQNLAKNRTSSSVDNTSGHAVYALVGSTGMKRNNTAGTGVNMNSGSTGSAGGWE